MVIFWIIATGLTLLALAFILPPLLRRPQQIADVERQAVNVAIYKDRLAELDNESLTPAQRAAAEQELQKTLLQDVQHETEAAKVVMAPRWGSALLVTVLVPTVAIAGYLYYGKPQLLTLETQSAAQTQREQAQSMEDSINHLAQRLAADPDNPDNLDGWLMLGRSYNVMNRFDEALQAYRKAMVLSQGQEPLVLVEYAEVLVMTNGGRWTEEPIRLVQSALKRDPQNQRGLFFAGIAAAQQGQHSQAATYWTNLLPLLPEEETKIRQMLQERIAQAHQLAGDEATPTTTSPTQTITTAAASHVQVAVSLSPKLQDRVTPSHTVFIYAKAAQGPPMPLAVARKTVADLPLTVTLDDSMAMMPQMKLSAFQRVDIAARVSPSANAMPQSGDFIGEMKNIDLVNNPEVTIVIDRILP